MAGQNSYRDGLPHPWDKAFDRLLGWIKDRYSEDSKARVILLLDTVISELQRITEMVEGVYAKMTPEEAEKRNEVLGELLHDGIRKAAETRSLDRVKRIGKILAGAVIASGPADGDDVEVMMRVAMNLTDQDATYLRERGSVIGSVVRSKGRITPQNAHSAWQHCSWDERIDPELESAFSKMESYGLVSRIPATKQPEHHGRLPESLCPPAQGSAVCGND